MTLIHQYISRHQYININIQHSQYIYGTCSQVVQHAAIVKVVSAVCIVLQKAETRRGKFVCAADLGEPQLIN